MAVTLLIFLIWRLVPPLARPRSTRSKKCNVPGKRGWKRPARKANQFAKPGIVPPFISWLLEERL